MAARILIVDDEKAIRKLFCRILQSVGYECIEAENGKEAIDLFKAQPTDMVITDIVMPEQEGIATILQLKKMPSKPKIIAISGGGRISADHYLALAEKIGADIALEKPVTRDELLRVVRELLPI